MKPVKDFRANQKKKKNYGGDSRSNLTDVWRQSL